AATSSSSDASSTRLRPPVHSRRIARSLQRFGRPRIPPGLPVAAAFAGFDFPVTVLVHTLEQLVGAGGELGLRTLTVAVRVEAAKDAVALLLVLAVALLHLLTGGLH